jgi:hypothetical protein
MGIFLTFVGVFWAGLGVFSYLMGMGGMASNAPLDLQIQLGYTMAIAVWLIGHFLVFLFPGFVLVGLGRLVIAAEKKPASE